VCRGYNQTTDSAQPDAEGRLWGYQNGANCVYIHPDGTPVKDVNELLPKGQDTPADTDKVGRQVWQRGNGWVVLLCSLHQQLFAISGGGVLLFAAAAAVCLQHQVHQTA
jgi:hypothetical protein